MEKQWNTMRHRNYLPQIRIIARNLQMPFPPKMEQQWRTMTVMSMHPVEFSSGN
jgi:hypothetical protein